MGLPLCAGIISGLYLVQDIMLLLIIAFFSAAGFALSIRYNKYQSNQLFGISLTAALFLAGIILYQNEKNSLSILKPVPSTFAGTLSDYPEEKKKSALLKVKLNTMSVSGKELTVKGSILIYNEKDSLVMSMLPGDQLVIKCTPAEITNRGNPYEFDYRFFMENKGIKYFAFTSSRNILSHKTPEHRKLIHRALIIREKIIEMYTERGISRERIALVSAITLGQKSKLTSEQKQIFIQAGVMHIMAVSGLHVVILSMFIFKLLFFIKGRFNIVRIIITIILLWSFAFVTGLTPSVLRATLMFTFLHAGNLLKRKVDGINSVLASAFVLILIKPSVIFDAGFLLSYSAVIFIICFYRELYLKIDIKNWLSDRIWQLAAVTITAQAGTLPLTIMLFNRFPTYFMITNVIIVPLSSLLVIIGSLIPLLFPLTIVSGLLGTVLNHLTGLTEYLTAKASSLPYSNIGNIGMTTPECMLLAVALFMLIKYFLNRKTIKPVFLFSVLLSLAVVNTAKDIYVRKSKELIVYNTPGVTTIGIRAGKILYVYSDTALMQPEVLRHGASLGLKIRQILLTDQASLLRAGKKEILICRLSDKNEQIKCHAEIVIVNGLKEKKKNNISFRYQPQSLIFTSDVPPGYNIPRNIKNEVRDTIHFVRNSGAFIKRL